MDAIKENEDAMLGATRDGFKKWLLHNSEYSDRIVESAFIVEDSKLEFALRERHWEEYLEELRYAQSASRLDDRI